MRERLFLPALAMVMVITSVVAGLGTPLIPQMVRHFGISLQEAQWVLTMPMLVGAVMSPLVGRLAGGGRQRRVLVGGLVLVTLGLLLSALPLGFHTMLAGRALQGLGLSLAPVAMSIVRGALGAEAALPALANLSASAVAAAGLAYPLSSLLAWLWGVPGAYWVGAGLALAALALVWYAIPRQGAVQRVAIDWWGVLMLGAGSGALLLLLSQIHGWSPWASLAAALGSASLIALWVSRSLRIADPLIDLRLAATPRVSIAHLGVLLAGAGAYLLLPLVMLAGQDPRAAGLSPLFAGFLLIPYSITSVIGAKLGNRLRSLLPLTALLLVGLAVYVVANLVLALWHADARALLVGMAIAGLGSGCSFAVIPQLIVQQVPREATSSALAFNMLLRYIGFSAGSALCPVLIAVAEGRPGGDAYTLPFLVAAGCFAGSIAILLLRRGRTAEG